MDQSNDDEGPVILQLKKWDPFQVRLDLSRFREAFISPTREILLLLSYQCEAMLLSLNTADSVDYSVWRRPYSEFSQDSSSEVSSSVNATTSEPFFMSSDDDYLHGKTSLYPNNYPFICDVKSLAWGVCADAYSDHNDPQFKEFLFVCGNHGVTVHAFCTPLKSTETVKTVDGVEQERGVWVQWGPSISSARDKKAQKNETTETGEGSFHSERWLQTFLTDVETLECDGKVLTRFPEKNSYPLFACTISFSIFRNLALLDFVPDASSSNNGERLNNMDLGSMASTCGNSHSTYSTESLPDVLSNFLGIGENMLCNCSRVFSSNHHQLIGFVLCLWEDGCGSKSVEGKTVVAVASLGVLGMHWVSSVNLEDNQDEGLVVDWKDFQFSDNLLACLSATGLIIFFEAITGECVVQLNIFKIYGLNALSNSYKRKKSGQKDLHNKKLTEGTPDLCSKILFKRLIAASHTSFLAVVDNHGAVYIMCAGDFVPDKFYPYEKLFPHYHHLGLGLLIGWKIGSSEISLQRGFSNIPVSRSTNYSPLMNFNSCCNQDIRDQNDLVSYSESLSHLMRKIFLPLYRSSEDDIICFSSLGITRLITKHDIEALKRSHIVHSNLHVGSTVRDDRCLYSAGKVHSFLGIEEACVGVAVGCTFQGCFYLVTDTGVSVVLPSVSVSSGFIHLESFPCWNQRINMDGGGHVGSIFTSEETMRPFSSWKLEVIDRVLVYEGSEEADHLCLKNGWDLKIPRMRGLQLSLEYLKFDEIHNSLEMLACVNLAEEGILRLLFVAVYLTFHIVGNDSEISAVSRLLALGTQISTKMIRKYGLLQNKINAESNLQSQIHYIPTYFLGKDKNESENSRRLKDIAHYLEIIRNVQHRLSEKFSRRDQRFENEGENGEDENSLLDGSLHLDFSAEATPSKTPSLQECNLAPSAVGLNTSQKLALVPIGSLEPEGDLTIMVSQGEQHGRNALFFENPKDMIARWEIDNLDVKTVVKDAVLSGRLPLAVLQLHLHQLKNTVAGKDPLDTFTEVCNVGKAIAYDLFLEGETELALTTLQRLGEDVETCLKQLTFGTLRSSLRIQISELLKIYGYLEPQESLLLERISIIERFYPCRSFWRTYSSRQKEVMGIPSSINLCGEHILCLLHSHLMTKGVIECGEIDGVVMGSWVNSSDNSQFPVASEHANHDRYWVAAAIWSDMWDQRIIDRIVLDQPSVMGSDILWESQFEYHVWHNDWEEVSKLLDIIPLYLLFDGNLQICLGGSRNSFDVECNWLPADKNKYLCTPDELDDVFMYVRDVKFFKFSANSMCSTWLRMLVEQKLAKKFIFIRECWDGTEEIVALLSNSGFISNRFNISSQEEYPINSPDTSLTDSCRTQPGIVQDFHRLIVRHCAVNNLPNFLDLYLDHHSLALDSDSLASLQESVGNCQWAKWLLLSRVRGHEYDASFANVHSVMSSKNVATSSNSGVLKIDEIIQTVDDIAEGGGELAALATLMYAPFPIQDCLSTSSMNRHRSSSAQCTLENLKPTLRHFPTLRRTLIAACLSQDQSCTFLGPAMKNSLGNSLLSEYLNWRANIFFTVGLDTSLLEMLPRCLSRSVRRLVQLYVQGPDEAIAGAKSLEAFMHRQKEFMCNSNEDEKGAMSWEVTIQKRIEEELHSSSLKDTGAGLEPQLHRGRALAAFNHLLGARIEKFKVEGTQEGQSDSSVHQQKNVQSDIQRLLAPLTESETSLLSSVKPLAIINFEDSVMVASCIFLLELCGLSASMLRVDVSALSRISCFYKSSESVECHMQHSPKSSAFHPVSHDSDLTYSLAHALADYYRHHACAECTKEKGSFNTSGDEQPAQALVFILQHLEKASLPLIADEKTCGTWLLDGNGDGIQLRSIQKSASQHWNLVSLFCQMHHIPLSTKYLAVLARDNDWIGFLSEAQAGGYHLDTIIRVVAREFRDQRLKSHILTVLRGMQLKKVPSFSSSSDRVEKSNENEVSDENVYFPVELFRILAECERKENPGNALLIKARELDWSILAMLASCFSDVSHLSCLTVWLEITAAREISSIKVNDIASVVAANVEAAVQTINSLPVDTGAPNIHYNRRKSKRQRLLNSFLLNSLDCIPSDISNPSNNTNMFFPQVLITDKENQRDSSEYVKVSPDSDEEFDSLSKMVVVLCEHHMFLPLLRAFEMFLPSCSLLPFIRALQAFSQMRLSEASAHLGSFSARIKEESLNLQKQVGRDEPIEISWIGSTVKRAADAVFSVCPSPYEKRCLLQLLAATDFSDGGFASTNYQRLFWKINIAEPSLRNDDALHLGSESLDDVSLLTTLEKNGHWEHARNWAKQLEASEGPWKSAVHHVTETQAESMVAEWKEFLWDVPEERVALWGHCQILFCRHSFPPLQAGLFFLKHAEAIEKNLPAREPHELLLLSLQWLSGVITQSNCVYPLHLLREIETRVWLLAVESETRVKYEGSDISTSFIREPVNGNDYNIIDRTASIIAKMDNHLNMIMNSNYVNDGTKNSQTQTKNVHGLDSAFSSSSGENTKTKRKAKGYTPSRRPLREAIDQYSDVEDGTNPLNYKNEMGTKVENSSYEISFSRWEERVKPLDLEKAVLSLLEFGQITAAKQLQKKLSSAKNLSEIVLVDVALKLANVSTPNSRVPLSELDTEVHSLMQSYNIFPDSHLIDPLQVLESLTVILAECSGRGLLKRIIAILKAANILGISFSEAFAKQPIEVLQLLSLKAQDSFDEANLLVQCHSMPASSIARILAESFLKGLLAAHRGGYMNFQKEEGPSPLLWRFSDFMKWVELCPSEAEVGHALMCLLITGQEIPHACEVELLILSHHFYRSSACLDGVDVVVALAATRVDAYVSEGDFLCLARLVTGVGNFHALNFILGILIENGQLNLLLHKISSMTDANTDAEAVRGFRMAVLTSLHRYNPNDLDSFALVYNHFDMKHESASLSELRANRCSESWLSRNAKDQTSDLLESMRHYIEAAEVHSSIDAGNKARAACAQASLLSLQIRIPDTPYLRLSDTNARRALVEEPRFHEALIVAEAYRLNYPSEWALVLWNRMLRPEVMERFMGEFLGVLCLRASMLLDVARFYRAEVAARGSRSLERSFRFLLRACGDLRLRLEVARVGSGFEDVVGECLRVLDRVAEGGGVLILRKGHGGAYRPLM